MFDVVILLFLMEQSPVCWTFQTFQSYLSLFNTQIKENTQSVNIGHTNIVMQHIL